MLAELAARLRASRAGVPGGGVQTGAHGLGMDVEGEGDPEDGPVRLVLGEDCSVM